MKIKMCCYLVPAHLFTGDEIEHVYWAGIVSNGTIYSIVQGIN